MNEIKGTETLAVGSLSHQKYLDYVFQVILDNKYSTCMADSLFQLVFGLYMMITTIVLINLLIAMMSDTYQRIQQQSDMEWKFGRSKLIT